MRRDSLLLVIAAAGLASVAGCAGLLGADGDYTETQGSTTTGATSTGSGGAGTTSTASTGAGGAPTSSSTSTGSGGAGTTSTASTGSGGASTSSSTTTSTGSGGAGTSSSTTTSTSTTTTTSTSTTSTTTSTSTGSGGGGPVSWNDYRFDTVSKTWSNVPLTSVWSGANAPPPIGIVTTIHLSHFDRLLVFTDDGLVYRRDGNTWQAPKATAEVFAKIVSPTTIASVWHFPSHALDPNPYEPPLIEQLTLSDNPTAYIFDYYSDGTATWLKTATMADNPDDPNEPPQGSKRSQWSFTLWDRSKFGSADVGSVWTAFEGDPYVYKFDMNLTWSKWTVASAPLWAGKVGAPKWASVRSAYFQGDFETGQGTIHFIVP